MIRKIHVDISVLHSYPLSNLNRDDLGSPKTAIYGGVVRGRVSSQATKRPVRMKIEEILGDHAARTRRVPRDVEIELTRRGWPSGEARQAAANLIKAADIKKLTVENRMTSTALYIPKTGIIDLANLADQNKELLIATIQEEENEGSEEEKPKTKGKKASAKSAGNPALKKIKPEVSAIISSRNPSIAAFGRMLADHGDSTVKGAICVNHPITTHPAPEQPDFFTAVDDLPGENAGSGHMGVNAFNSGTYYRFGSIDLRELLVNLEGNLDVAEELTGEFLREFAVTVPPAKRTSTAPYTPPSLVYCSVRTDQLLNLAGAFEAPVEARNGSGYIAPSIAALNRHVQATHDFYGTEVIAAHGHSGTADLTGLTALGDCLPRLSDLVTMITNAGMSLLSEAQGDA